MIAITRNIMMYQVLYIVQLPNEEGEMHMIIEGLRGKVVYPTELQFPSKAVKVKTRYFILPTSFVLR